MYDNISPVILGMINVPDVRCRENQNTHFILNIFFFSEGHADYEVMCKNIVKPDTPPMTIYHV